MRRVSRRIVWNYEQQMGIMGEFDWIPLRRAGHVLLEWKADAKGRFAMFFLSSFRIAGLILVSLPRCLKVIATTLVSKLYHLAMDSDRMSIGLNQGLGSSSLL